MARHARFCAIQNLAARLLPLFSPAQAVLGRSLDKRNFRKKMQSLGVLRALAEWRRTGRKPARLYTVAAARLEKLEQKQNLPSI